MKRTSYIDVHDTQPYGGHMMKNLLSMEHLTTEEINHILDLAQAFENGETSSLSRTYNVANLFLNQVHGQNQASKWLSIKLAVISSLSTLDFRV